jgi:hypothetical protein
MSDGTGVPSFEAFAESSGLRPRTKGCTIGRLDPEVRAQVDTAWSQGYRWRAINQYLTAIGAPNLSDGQLQKHYGDGHDCS